jgi:hypothetical protein
MDTEFDDIDPLEADPGIDNGEPRLYTDWEIKNEGRSWGDEAWDRYQRTPEKIEMFEGRLFWTDEDRVNMLGLLLELVGADRAVQLGDPEVWQKAVAKLGSAETGP